MGPVTPETSSQSSALLAAVRWFEQLLLGAVGTSLALVAVALLGFAMLGGRLSPRDGLRVVLGCFVLFGAPMLAAGLLQIARPGPTIAVKQAPAASPKLPKKAPDFDPYAGAAVPTSQ